MQEALLNEWEARFVRYLTDHLGSDDASHDLGHFRRVWRTCRRLLAEEGSDADPLVLLAAAYFHDIVSLPKNHPEAARSSELSAAEAALILATHFPDFPSAAISEVGHAIHAHSYSAGITPTTSAAKILQDADRMEALGAIGIARTFYTGGRLHTSMFSPDDPQGHHRVLNDKVYSLDHFELKLLKLPGLMNTAAGRRMAEARAAFLQTFREQLIAEING